MKRQYGVFAILATFLVTFLVTNAAQAGKSPDKSPECIRANVDLADGLISKAARDKICNSHIKENAKKADQKLKDAKKAFEKNLKKNAKKTTPKREPENKCGNSLVITKDEFKQWFTAFISEEGDLGKLKARIDQHHPDKDEPVIMTVAEFEKKQSETIWTVVIILFVSIFCLALTGGIVYWLYKKLKENEKADEDRTRDFEALATALVQKGVIDQNDL